jgi:hypothetical protein
MGRAKYGSEAIEVDGDLVSVDVIKNEIAKRQPDIRDHALGVVDPEKGLTVLKDHDVVDTRNVPQLVSAPNQTGGK